jgi:hypothetical protein
MPHREPKEISEELLQCLRKCRLIGIHGLPSSGKTPLAKELAQRICGTHVEVDLLLFDRQLDRTQYVDRVKYAELTRKLQSKVAWPIIIDCFVLLDVLARVNVSVDELLLCERVAPAGSDFGKEGDEVFEDYRRRHQVKHDRAKMFTMFYSESDFV